MDRDWEEDKDANPLFLPSTIGNTGKGNISDTLSISSQLNSLNPKKIYWNKEEEIYVQESGM